MQAQVVQHTASEGPGRLAVWLAQRGIELRATHPYRGDHVPASVEGDALIVLGGPMNAYDDDAAPWLPRVRSLLATAVADDVPTLGVCLGAQLLAVTVGGRVERGVNGPEIGLGTVAVPVGDALLAAGTLPVVQWHHDAVTALPASATVLASSDAYPIQAFRAGRRAWGLQFHLETTPEMVAGWAVDDGLDSSVASTVRDADDRVAAAGEAMANRFAAMITG